MAVTLPGARSGGPGARRPRSGDLMETGGGREVASVGWMRVLLVERHPELRRVLGELLASEGLGVYPVDSPAAAAAALARGVHVDVVLVDEDTAPYEVM